MNTLRRSRAAAQAPIVRPHSLIFSIYTLTMRYFKSTAFILLAMGSSVSVLSRSAIAQLAEADGTVLSNESTLPNEAANTANDSSTTDETKEVADSPEIATPKIATPKIATIDLSRILNGAEQSALGNLVGSELVDTEPADIEPANTELADVDSVDIRSDSNGLESDDSETESQAVPTVSETQAPQFSSPASDSTANAQASSSRLTLDQFREMVSAIAAKKQLDAKQSDSSQPNRNTETTEVAVEEVAVEEVAVEEVAVEEVAVEDRTKQVAQAEEDLPVLDAPDPDAPTAAPDEPIPSEPGATDPSAPTVPDIVPDSLPALPDSQIEGEPEVVQPIPSDEPVEGAEPELGDLPDILFADPNPLNLPTTTEGVEIERNPVVTLEQAIELAYRNSQVLQAAILQLEQADAAVEQARAANLPTLSTSAGITSQQRDAVEGGINPFTGQQLPGQDAGIDTAVSGNLRLEYDLLTGGSRKATIRQAELQRENAALVVETQQEQLRLVTANNYYALQEAGEQIRIQRTFLEEAERNLRDARLRQEVGVGTRFDTLRAEVQYANARQQVIQAQGNQRIARRDISRLLNLPPNAGLQTSPVTVAENWPLTLEESILLAFDNRAELEQQLLQADINEQQRQIALSSVRPRVGLFADYSLQSLLNDGADDIEDNYSFGATFNMLLFDGGAARASARQQEIASQVAEEQFSESADQIRFDVEQAFFGLETNQENIATSRIAVSQAEEALELANLRLQAGVGTQLDVLTAQSELTQAQANNVSAILDYNRALAAMQRAVSNVTLE